jgi:drug/metabolite transporter (DMT)-like permease
MTGLAFILVLISAFCHATWNLLAKRARGGTTFVWLFSTLATVIYFPVMLAVVILQRPHLNTLQLIFIIGSAILHVAYFLLLQQGYRIGDLSLIYPLARGTGPLLSTIAAIVILGERPSLLALIGVLSIIGGVFVLVGGLGQISKLSSRSAILYAIFTGVFIASYTIWDKYAVSTLLISPILFDWSSNLTRSLILSPLALRQWDTVREEWRLYRREAIGVAVLSSLAYILVLIALTFSPVSHIAPMREMSILIGTMMGTHLLSEGNKSRRLLAAGVIVLGVILLALT